MASVTRRPAGARGRRADKRSENLRLLTRALSELLAEGAGFTELSVERLVTRAGVSRSTFYAQFGDKGTLLRELTGDLVTRLLAAGRGWWAEEAPASRAELRERVAVIVDTYRPHAELMRAVTDTSGHDPAVREVFRELTGRYISELTEHIEHGQRAGTVRADLPAGAVAEMLTWTAERGFGQMLRHPAHDADPPSDVTDVVDAFTAIAWSTLYEGAGT